MKKGGRWVIRARQCFARALVGDEERKVLGDEGRAVSYRGTDQGCRQRAVGV